MTEEKIKILINKYLEGKCSLVEKKLLEDFLDSYQEGDSKWNDLVYGDKNLLEKRIFKNIKENIPAKKKTKLFELNKKAFTFMKYAAIIVIGAIAAISFFTNETIDIIDPNEIVLELNDGTKKIINLESNEQIKNAKGQILGSQDKEKLVYQSKATKNELAFNKLYVPYGKKIKIELSDGSLVHLNSGSTLKYPVQFIKGMDREVFLNGEAYFEVSKNKEDAFIVNSNDVYTKVYGTEFNVSSYKNDDNEEVVLVEGSVGVYNNTLDVSEQNQILLVPNEKASFDKNNGQLSAKKVNVEKYIAWKNGVLLFENERFENIIRRLERHYNVSIQNNSSVLNNIRFTGTFDIETIDQVLNSFNSYRSFTYTRNETQIIINP